MMCRTCWANPFTHGKILGQWILIATDVTNLTRRIEGVHLQDFTAMQFCLVCQHTEEFAPRNICYSLCQAVIFHHVLHLQMLHSYRLIFTS